MASENPKSVEVDALLIMRDYVKRTHLELHDDNDAIVGRIDDALKGLGYVEPSPEEQDAKKDAKAAGVSELVRGVERPLDYDKLARAILKAQGK